MIEPEAQAREGIAGFLGAFAVMLVIGALVALAIGLLIMPDLPYERLRGWMIVQLLFGGLGVSMAGGLALSLAGLGLLLFVLGLSPWKWFTKRPPVEVLPADVEIAVREERK